MTTHTGTIKSVTETNLTFAVEVTNANPPPETLVIPQPPDWSKDLFRAGIGKTVEWDEDDNTPPNVTRVKVSK